MSSHESYYNQTSSSQAGPPPPPPPKSYTQGQVYSGRSDAPLANSSSAGPPSLPPQPSQSPYQQQPESTYIRSPPPVPYSPPPQTPKPAQQHSYQTYPPPTQASPYPSQTQVQLLPTGNQPRPQSQLPIQFALPENIKTHTTADLSSLLGKPDLLSQLAIQHPAYTEATRPIQSQIATNLALAQQLSTLEVQVKSLRDQTAQLLLQHTNLQTQWRRKQTEMDEALAPWGPRAMYQRLVAGINEQEALLRAVYESFLDGGATPHNLDSGFDWKATEKDVNDWIKRIRDGTITLEKRKEVKSRWDEGRVGGFR